MNWIRNIYNQGVFTRIETEGEASWRGRDRGRGVENYFSEVEDEARRGILPHSSAISRSRRDPRESLAEKQSILMASYPRFLKNLQIIFSHQVIVCISYLMPWWYIASGQSAWRSNSFFCWASEKESLLQPTHYKITWWNSSEPKHCKNIQ